ncbi:MAG: sugar ABC transporter substrate-binding protein [Thermomicrobiales bacterium]
MDSRVGLFEQNLMPSHETRNVVRSRVNRRALLRRSLAFGLAAPALSILNPKFRGAAAQEVSCPPVASPVAAGTPMPATGMRIGATVAYLSVPFYAGFMRGLEDGARQFGFEYDLRDGEGDPATEVANMQNFIAEGVDLILLTPMSEGTIPAIIQANEAGIPVIAGNNRAGFGSDEAEVVTYVGADDVEFGRLQAQLLDQTYGGEPVKIGYVMGIPGTSPQILRAQGFKEELANHPEYEIVAEATNDFDSAKALAVTQDLLSRFPEGELDVIVMQGPEGVAAADFARQNGREDVQFILGDYPADVRQAIVDGYVLGTINQDPYPQAYEAMRMASLYLSGQEDQIPKPFFLELPIITIENAEATPPAWGC